MNIKEVSNWIGKLKIETIKNNSIIRVNKYKNLITNNALNEIIKSLYSYPNMNLKYVAIGTDSTAAAATDETLGAEIYRTPIISQYISGTGELTSRAILLPTEPFAAPSPPSHEQCTIREIGFFAGDEAEDWNDGAGIDTGLLIARVIVNETKSDNEQVNITRIDSQERG
jgi:hypothetical protein